MINLKLTHLLPVSALILSLAACQDEKKPPVPPDILASNLDTTISPGTDFFSYANGGWIKNSTIPPEESSWDIGQLVQEDIYRRLREISEKAADTTAAADSVTRQMGGCINSERKQWPAS